MKKPNEKLNYGRKKRMKRTEETTGGADQIEDNKKEDSLFCN